MAALFNLFSLLSPEELFSLRLESSVLVLYHISLVCTLSLDLPLCAPSGSWVCGCSSPVMTCLSDSPLGLQESSLILFSSVVIAYFFSICCTSKDPSKWTHQHTPTAWFSKQETSLIKPLFQQALLSRWRSVLYNILLFIQVLKFCLCFFLHLPVLFCPVGTAAALLGSSTCPTDSCAASGVFLVFPLRDILLQFPLCGAHQLWSLQPLSGLNVQLLLQGGNEELVLTLDPFLHIFHLSSLF